MGFDRARHHDPKRGVPALAADILRGLVLSDGADLQRPLAVAATTVSALDQLTGNGRAECRGGHCTACRIN